MEVDGGVLAAVAPSPPDFTAAVVETSLPTPSQSMDVDRMDDDTLIGTTAADTHDDSAPTESGDSGMSDAPSVDVPASDEALPTPKEDDSHQSSSAVDSAVADATPNEAKTDTDESKDSGDVRMTDQQMEPVNEDRDSLIAASLTPKLVKSVKNLQSMSFERGSFANVLAFNNLVAEVAVLLSEVDCMSLPYLLGIERSIPPLIVQRMHILEKFRKLDVLLNISVQASPIGAFMSQPRWRQCSYSEIVEHFTRYRAMTELNSKSEVLRRRTRLHSDVALDHSVELASSIRRSGHSAATSIDFRPQKSTNSMIDVRAVDIALSKRDEELREALEENVIMVRGQFLGKQKILAQFFRSIRDNLCRDHSHFLSVSALNGGVKAPPNATDLSEGRRCAARAILDVSIARFYAICHSLCEFQWWNEMVVDLDSFSDSSSASSSSSDSSSMIPSEMNDYRKPYYMEILEFLLQFTQELLMRRLGDGSGQMVTDYVTGHDVCLMLCAVVSLERAMMTARPIRRTHLQALVKHKSGKHGRSHRSRTMTAMSESSDSSEMKRDSASVSSLIADASTSSDLASQDRLELLYLSMDELSALNKARPEDNVLRHDVFKLTPPIIVDMTPTFRNDKKYKQRVRNVFRKFYSVFREYCLPEPNP